MTEILKFVPKTRWPGFRTEKPVVPVTFDANGGVHRVTSPPAPEEWVWLAQSVEDARILPCEIGTDKTRIGRVQERAPSLAFD